VQQPLWDRIAGLQVPCLIMAGELDLKFVEIAQRMATAIPSSRLALVADSGHAIHLESPDEFVRLVIGFAGARTSES
jgi:2-succinyl-6-hydroxy-2,4-cyclohexadiene-1-carboxylate synthase